MMLAQEFAEDQTVEVIADRRLGERRRPLSSSRDERPERRWHDRRGTCPFCFQCVFVAAESAELKYTPGAAAARGHG